MQFLLAHFFGDFLLQSTGMVREKEGKKAASPKLYIHVFIHAFLLFLFTWDINLWLPILIISAAHFGIDILKIYLQKPHTKRVWFFIDQILHLAVIFLVFSILKNPDFKFNFTLSDKDDLSAFDLSIKSLGQAVPGN